jgi:hypothetical protein
MRGYAFGFSNGTLPIKFAQMHPLKVWNIYARPNPNK